MEFHLAHMVPDNVAHGLNGYKDVIDTVQWGLSQLGHSAEYGLNTLSQSATNIIFGAQMLPLSVFANLSPDTIVYNFEQIRGVSAEHIKPALLHAAGRFQVWDYSEANVERWHALGAKDARVVPVGYAPILRRIPRPPVQDIDVLMYGLPGPERLKAFFYLAECGLKTMFFSGLYGEERDALVGRAKVIVNVSRYPESNIFESVRVSYLLANDKAVVTVLDDNAIMDDDLRLAVKCSTQEQLIRDCRQLVLDDSVRHALEVRGFDIIRQRDVRTILAAALSADAVAV